MQLYSENKYLQKNKRIKCYSNRVSAALNCFPVTFNAFRFNPLNISQHLSISFLLCAIHFKIDDLFDYSNVFTQKLFFSFNSYGVYHQSLFQHNKLSDITKT